MFDNKCNPNHETDIKIDHKTIFALGCINLALNILGAHEWRKKSTEYRMEQGLFFINTLVLNKSNLFKNRVLSTQ